MIIVSACLAGVECRYNGQAFPISEVMDLVRLGRAIPLCPELLGGLPTKRPSAERYKDKILTRDGQDITAEFLAGAAIAAQIARLAGCTMAILKSRSPSCGHGQIYDGTFSGKVIPGNGVFCERLEENNITVYTENDLPNAICDIFDNSGEK